MHLERAAELDFNCLLRPGDLPRIGVSQPIVRVLVLPAVLDGLAENALLVAQPVAHRRELHGGHRVEEAGREAPKSAVAQPGVRFLFQHLHPIDASQ